MTAARTGCDYRFIEGFEPDLIFALPPNPLHPNEYAFWRGEPYPLTTAREVDFLRDDDPMFVVRAHGAQRAYPWFLASKPHAINDYFGDVPVAVFF